MTSEEIALTLLKPIFEEMREICREKAATGELDAEGDAERRNQVIKLRLIDEVHNDIESRIGIANNDD